MTAENTSSEPGSEFWHGTGVGGLRSGPLRIHTRQTEPRRSSTRYPAASSAIACSA
jgi:hypothetical protein